MSQENISKSRKGVAPMFAIAAFGLWVSLGLSSNFTPSAYATVNCATGEVVDDPSQCPAEVHSDCEGEACVDGYTDGELTDLETIEDTTLDRSDPDSEAEVISDPVLWPMYLSLGTIAATLVLIFLINFIGRRKHKN